MPGQAHKLKHQTTVASQTTAAAQTSVMWLTFLCGNITSTYSIFRWLQDDQMGVDEYGTTDEYNTIECNTTDECNTAVSNQPVSLVMMSRPPAGVLPKKGRWVS